MGLSHRIAGRMAWRRDKKIVRELVLQFDELHSAGWDDLNALHVVFDLAWKMNASPNARHVICIYGPIRETIEANPDDLHIRRFLGTDDPEMTLQFPGPA